MGELGHAVRSSNPTVHKIVPSLRYSIYISKYEERSEGLVNTETSALTAKSKSMGVGDDNFGKAVKVYISPNHQIEIHSQNSS